MICEIEFLFHPIQIKEKQITGKNIFIYFILLFNYYLFLEKQQYLPFKCALGAMTWLDINLFKPTLKWGPLYKHTAQLEWNGHLNTALLMRIASMKWLYSFN